MILHQKQGARAVFAVFGAAVLMALAGCGGGPEAPEIPQFPAYAPTQPFLEMQAKVRQRAREIEERQELEIRLNLIKGQNKFYRAWAPIYERVKAAQRKPRQ